MAATSPNASRRGGLYTVAGEEHSVAATITAAPPSEAAEAVDSRRAQYIEELQAQAAVYPAVPDVTVAFDFSYTLQLPPEQDETNIPTVLEKMFFPVFKVANAVRGRKRAPAPLRTLHVLSECRGEFRPGTMSLLLAPPGHGKSSLLRAVAGQIPAAELAGSITYNGVPVPELAKRGIRLSLLAAYVDQIDIHLPFLTVRETISFADALANVEPSVMGHELLVKSAKERVDRVIRLLHLESCSNTMVGNHLVRGVSGGERKRVSVAEAFVSNARVVCLDEISTGLDSSVTYDIISCIGAWARTMRATVVISLQQPTPEVYGLFDEIVLLREGCTVFHGPRESVPLYFRKLGFNPPKGMSTAAISPAGGGVHGQPSDIADWLLDFLTSPTKMVRRDATIRRASLASVASVGSEGAASAENGAGEDGKKAPPPPKTTAQLAEAWTKSGRGHAAAPAGAGAAAADGDSKGHGLELTSDFAKRQYGSQYPRSAVAALSALVRRQGILAMRNKVVFTTRLFAACVISVVLGMVWFKLQLNQGAAKLGLFVFALAQVSFANFPEIGWAVTFRPVGFKQIRAGMYPGWAYAVAASILQVPVAFVESCMFSIILYFMAHLVLDAGRFFFFLLIVFLVDMSVGSLFRLLAYLLPTPEAAAAAPGPFVALQLAFAGFLVSPANMGTAINGIGWMVFLFYTSVFAYGARSLAQNEFLSPPYDIYPAANTTVATQLGGGTNLVPLGAVNPPPSYFFTKDVCNAHPLLRCGAESYGVQSLRVLNISTIPAWKWGGVGFLLGFTLLMNRNASAVVSKSAYKQAGKNVGSSRVPDETEAEDAEKHEDVELPSHQSVLPFQEMTVAWRHLTYTVQLPSDLGGGSRQLLQGVSGVARPGRLLALMGASGAGKTTLLDVIASRKSQGTVSGSVFLNGFPMEPKSFARNTAYCEQMDVHSELTTVREALLFSAALRLPASVDRETRLAFVQEIAERLELKHIMGRIVGSVGESGSLAPGQRKVLTIAVELASNAPIVFLDEPTSGLDSRAAMMVMRVVHRIARTGRTTISTIHQPSSELFFLFDDLLLLQRGGWMTYFGPLGAAGRDVVGYLERVPGAHECPQTMNPASWMLDVLSGTDSSSEGAAGAAATGEPKDGKELQALLFQSKVWQEGLPEMEAACKPKDGASPFAFDSVYARSLFDQWRIVAARLWRTYDRNLGYVFARTKTLSILNMLFGIVFYKCQQAVDCAPAQDLDDFRCVDKPTEVQAVMSVLFLSCLFVSVVHQGAALPFFFRQRPAFMRERLSFMYSPEAHALSLVTVEIPWLILSVVIVITPLYFLAGFEMAASSYFFYIFVVFLTCCVFLSQAMVCCAYFSTMAISSAFVSSIMPLVALFAGVYIPKPQIPFGAENGHPGLYLRWVFYANPVAHAIEALGPMRFVDMSRPSTVNHTIQIPFGAGTRRVDGYLFYAKYHDVYYNTRWKSVGYICTFIGGLQVLHFVLNRRKIHASR